MAEEGIEVTEVIIIIEMIEMTIAIKESEGIMTKEIMRNQRKIRSS
jgi:hypothetical protein